MKNLIEEWRAIPGYKGLYDVSNYGEVKILKRKWVAKDRVLTGFLRKGYQRVNLRNGTDKSKQFSVHTLVAMAFLDFIPCGMEKVIDHIDFDKTNNHVSNLRITTNRENCSKDKWRKSPASKCVGVSSSRKKWRARIYAKGKHIVLGYFILEEDANKAYHDALFCVKEDRIKDIVVHKKRNVSSKYKLVHFNKANNQWISRVRVNGKNKYLGCFKTELQAYEAQQKTQRA